MLWHTLSELPVGGTIGVVVPYSILHNRNSTNLREQILKDFEIIEVCKFPDNIFTFSDMESAVIIGRKVSLQRHEINTISYRTVRERDSARFRSDYHFTVMRNVDKSHFLTKPDFDMRLPELEEVWLWCRHLHEFRTIADIGKGLQFKGRLLPPGSITYSKHRFPGGKHGFVHFDRRLKLHDLPDKYWMNLDPSVLHRPGTGTKMGIPQVLINYAPVSRGPWRLKALLDREGHPVTSRFLTVRPKSNMYSPEYLWAVCNSPIANAFAFTHSGKRDNLAGMVRKLPIPQVVEADVRKVSELVERYIGTVSSSITSTLKSPANPASARDLLLQIDAEVLHLYDFPPRLERQVLDFFAGWERQGVPFQFDRYFPDDFEPCFPLHEYLSESYAASTADYLLKQSEPKIPSEFLHALDEATKAFEE